MSNGLDPDQDQHFAGPDLDPNCLQRLSADNASSQRVKNLHLQLKTLSCTSFFVRLNLSKQIWYFSCMVPLQIVMHGISEVLASTRVVPALVTLGNDPEM